MMYFFPSDEFQIREKRFIEFAVSGERGGIYRLLTPRVNGSRESLRNWLELPGPTNSPFPQQFLPVA